MGGKGDKIGEDIPLDSAVPDIMRQDRIFCRKPVYSSTGIAS